jgi:hypothetical protein
MAGMSDWRFLNVFAMKRKQPNLNLWYPKPIPWGKEIAEAANRFEHSPTSPLGPHGRARFRKLAVRAMINNDARYLEEFLQTISSYVESILDEQEAKAKDANRG